MAKICWPLLLVSLSACAQTAPEFHGYIQGRFTDQPGTPERLEVRRARLIAGGELLPGLSYKAQGDFAKSPYLMDASLSWRVSRAVSLSFGQMKIPFSAESLVSDDRNAPVARSRAVLALSPGRDTGVQGRDVGAQVSGTLGHNERGVEYAVGVFRGQTLLEAPRVHDEAVAGRLLARFGYGISLGADWYGSFRAIGGPVKRREDLEASYERGRMNLRMEQIFARDGALLRRGGYVTGVWRLPAHWEAVLRTDWLTANAAKPAQTSRGYIGGVNVVVLRHVKIGFDAGAQHDSQPKGWSSVVLAQLMPFF